MSQPDFVEWPKTSRLFRDAVVTEKIDGTNGAVVITDDGDVFAQSRTRMIPDDPKQDNYGFRAWVTENADALRDTLGPGRHFGEWWGKGIQRGYNLDHKRFSLFNTAKWNELGVSVVPQLHVVPVLGAYTFSTDFIKYVLNNLEMFGSHASPGFMQPEGVCIYHHASNSVFKATIKNDALFKGAA